MDIQNLMNNLDQEEDEISAMRKRSWYMYFPENKRDPETAEEEISLVLKSMEKQISYFASVSDELDEEDYSAYITEWVLKRQKECGISNAEDIRLYSFRLNEDMNRYRGEHGYREKIPVQFMKSFTTVYTLYKSNPWMTQKDVDQLTDKVIEQSKYIQKAINKKVPTMFFKGLVESVLFKDNEKVLAYYRNKKSNVSDAYVSMKKYIKSATKKEFNDNSLDNIVQCLIENNNQEKNAYYKNSVYYDVVFTIIKEKNLAPIMTQESATDYLYSCLSGQNLSSRDINKIAEASWVCGIKTSEHNIKELIDHNNASPLYRQICKYLLHTPYKKEVDELRNKLGAYGVFTNRVGLINTDSRGRKEIIVNYVDCKNMDVLVKEENEYVLAKKATFEKFIKGRNLLMHNDKKSHHLSERRASKIMIGDQSAVELLNKQINLENNLLPDKEEDLER